MTFYSVDNPDLTDSAEFLRLAAEKYKEANPQSKSNYIIETFDYVDENHAICGSYGTEEAADILYEGYFNMSGYVNHGHLAWLDDIITNEIRSDISEASWQQSQKNGNTYMMPFVSLQNILAFNKDLFKKAGLDQYVLSEPVIQNMTLEEWTNILDTLAQKLPSDCSPMMMFGANNQGDTHILAFLRSHGGDYFADDGTFDFTSPKVVEALSWIQKGVEKGWYVPHPENLELLDNQQLFADNRLCFYIFNNGFYSESSLRPPLT